MLGSVEELKRRPAEKVLACDLGKPGKPRVHSIVRVEMTAQVTIRVLRSADGIVVGESSGTACKSATLTWQTPYVSGGSASPELRLEAEVVQLAIGDALKKYMQAKPQ